MKHEWDWAANNIEAALYISAHWAWDRRATAKATGFPFSEETITETILLDIASMCPGQVHIVPFNKREEGKLGADWEWCFYDLKGNRYLRFLMQAKVLDDSDYQYAHIDRYIGNSSVRQIDRLKDTADRRGIAALYAFYNHLTNERRLPAHKCTCLQCAECWGASVATLDAVLDALPDKSFDTLKQVSFPWVCLLHHAPASGDPSDVLSSVLAGLRVLERQAREGERPTDPTPTRGIERDPPYYLRHLRELPSDMSPSERDMHVRKVAADNPGVDGVVLIDATPESSAD